ncbi:MAG: alpha/beta hydrolase [Actinomycetota bacterium]
MAELERDGEPAIHYVDHGGDGPPAVLVHGITESAASWDPIVERLGSDHRTVALDLRGHGRSGTADRYDLEVMAGDVVAVLQELDLLGTANLVGHSLGGAVVSAVGAAAPVASVVNVDQSLQLGGFKAQLGEIEAPLKDAGSFPAVMEQMFEQLAGPLLSAPERARVGAVRRADQDVVLGIWALLFDMTAEEVDQVVATALGGYAGRNVPYLTVFGVDPGPGYGEWLAGSVEGAQVEVWADHGHYPHLVDPDRFVERLRAFWAS